MKTKCRARRCRNRIDKKKTHSPFCPKCRSRNFKLQHPAKYAYNKKVQRAKAGGKPFTMTLQEFAASKGLPL